MNLQLAKISANVAPDARAVLASDGAGWHQTDGCLRVPNNITPLHLPPYSPELNPVENVWAFLSVNKLSNCMSGSYDAVVEACCEAWNWLAQQPVRIATLGSRSWARAIS
ncbi:transposase [Roseomonas mucosa]